MFCPYLNHFWSAFFKNRFFWFALYGCSAMWGKSAYNSFFFTYLGEKLLKNKKIGHRLKDILRGFHLSTISSFWLNYFRSNIGLKLIYVSRFQSVSIAACFLLFPLLLGDRTPCFMIEMAITHRMFLGATIWAQLRLSSSNMLEVTLVWSWWMYIVHTLGEKTSKLEDTFRYSYIKLYK